jgi:hypothetical protein
MRTRTLLEWLVICAGVLLVMAPRFDGVGLERSLAGQTMAPEERSFDQAQYVEMVERYRGKAPSLELRPAYSYRPLVPWIASRLPFRPSTALNVLNVLALCGAAAFVLRTLRLYVASSRLVWLGTLLFVWSFPVFWYGPDGMTDPAAILVVAAGLYFLLRGHSAAFVVALGIGALIKEATIILLPVALAHVALRPPRSPRDFVFLLLGVVSFTVGSVVGRVLSPLNGDYLYWFGWQLSANLWRTRAYLSFLLTLGVQGAIAIAVLPTLVRRYRDHVAVWGPLTVGLAASVTLFVIAMFIAYADGRFVWLSQPFTTPLAMYGLSVVREERAG